FEGDVYEFTSEGSGYCLGNVYGTYVHGVFDADDMAAAIVKAVAASKGRSIDTSAIKDYREYKEIQYEKLADALEQSLDMKLIYELMGMSPS
ncbi:MAG: hypothetical protein J6X66_12600, partial [Lachnospiraceae bacterium]|nr:hypothetical protein [Lachnospiraceae bacterium]